MDWLGKIVALVFIGFSLFHAYSQETIVGIWQDEPVLASGWSENYRFFEDGSFVFSHNQMDCQDSVISMGGYYKVKRNKIRLKFISIEYIEGGELVPATGSCGSEYEIVGGTIVSTSYSEKKKLSLSSIEQDSEFEHLHFILIGEKKYWKLGWDPKEY